MIKVLWCYISVKRSFISNTLQQVFFYWDILIRMLLKRKENIFLVFSSSKLEKFFKLDEWKDSEQHSLLVIVGNNELRIFIYLMLLKLNCMHFKEIKLQSVSSTVASHQSSCKQLAIMHHAANKWVARNFNNEGKTIHSQLNLHPV